MNFSVVRLDENQLFLKWLVWTEKAIYFDIIHLDFNEVQNFSYKKVPLKVLYSRKFSD